MSINPWNDPMQRAIAEAQARITAVYPEATFRLVEGEDPRRALPGPTLTPRMPLQYSIWSVTGWWISA
jgi:hypothetical protein